MIDLIYLENGLYTKRLLTRAWDNHVEESIEAGGFLDFKTFVERVFTAVINWYTYDMQEDDERLSILGYELEDAEDLLDAMSGFDLKILEDWSMKFKVEYLERTHALIIRCERTTNELILPDPTTYVESYGKMRHNQLTKIARLLNVVRQSKAGELG